MYVCVCVCMTEREIMSSVRDNWNALYLSMSGNQMTDDANILWMRCACVYACYVSGYEAADI